MYRSDELVELLRPPAGPLRGDAPELQELLNPLAPPLPLALRHDDDADDCWAA